MPYNNAASILKVTQVEGGGVTATKFSEFLPGHDYTFKGKMSNEDCQYIVLRRELQKDESLILYKHSDDGK